MDEEDSDADGEVRIVDRDRLQRVRQQARSARDREDESHGPGDNHEEENPQDDSDGSSDALLNQPPVVRRSNTPAAIHHKETRGGGRRSRVPRARTPLGGFLNRDRSARNGSGSKSCGSTLNMHQDRGGSDNSQADSANVTLNIGDERKLLEACTLRHLMTKA